MTSNGYKIVSLNVRGLRGKKRYTIYNWIKDNSFDICLLQETFCTKDFAKEFKRGWKGEILHSYTDSCHSRGVCILFKGGVEIWARPSLF